MKLPLILLMFLLSNCATINKDNVSDCHARCAIRGYDKGIWMNKECYCGTRTYRHE